MLGVVLLNMCSPNPVLFVQLKTPIAICQQLFSLARLLEERRADFSWALVYCCGLGFKGLG